MTVNIATIGYLNPRALRGSGTHPTQRHDQRLAVTLCELDGTGGYGVGQSAKLAQDDRSEAR
jgi:hypothetical protein